MTRAYSNYDYNGDPLTGRRTEDDDPIARREEDPLEGYDYIRDEDAFEEPPDQIYPDRRADPYDDDFLPHGRFDTHYWDDDDEEENEIDRRLHRAA